MDECKLSAAPQLKQLSVHRPAGLMALLDLAGLAGENKTKTQIIRWFHNVEHLAVGVTNPEVPFMTSQRLPELCVLE